MESCHGIPAKGRLTSMMVDTGTGFVLCRVAYSTPRRLVRNSNTLLGIDKYNRQHGPGGRGDCSCRSPTG